ncbi:MAG: hypothetical protein K9M10_01390 [Candidatus Pacebacteria bacterium]|nr:hypothetical protein [Candidatus Paceibacterota bacterium]MCF7857117.1 hypothetical protein [Candidatus Paceibacterota bacterium]
MSIQEIWLKFKGLLNNADFVLSVLIIVVALISFILGRFSVSENVISTQNAARVLPQTDMLETVESIPRSSATNSQKTDTSNLSEGGYVASKSGTKYHLPWCGSAKQIKEENKVWFATKEEAEKAGYTPASNCKGI